ncbi:MAG: PP2C family protein-serine/threonine phosphatase [Candidatus Eiseniibacteriota bacterium]
MIFAVDWLRPPVTVLATVAFSGLIACAFLACFIHGLRWLPLVIAAQIGIALAIERWMPAGTDPKLHPPSVEDVARRATIDGVGCMLLIIAGYGFFIAFITREGVTQVQLDTEMRLAQGIHESLVPRIEGRFGRFEVVGRSLASSHVGGDLVDAFMADGKLVAVVADVSGHGVAAGTLMAMMRSALRMRAAMPCTLEQLFGDLDGLLIDLQRPDKFVTAACMRFDPAGRAEAMLAGHLPILKIRAGAAAVERIESERPPLGIPGAARAVEVRFEAGDLFAFLTDGLTEVLDGKRRLLDLDALEAVLRERSAAPLGEIADALFARASEHGAITDDQTVLLVRPAS